MELATDNSFTTPPSDYAIKQGDVIGVFGGSWVGIERLYRDMEGANGKRRLDE